MKQLDPTTEAVALWLKQLERKDIHGEGWIEINKRFHGITHAVRPFLLQRYPDDQERQAAFDGLTLALMAAAHFEDIARINKLLDVKSSNR
jgi:hypothetical protein